MGPAVKSLDSLTLETLWLTPIALGLWCGCIFTSGLSLGTLGPWHTALLLMAGAVTSIPLLFFGAAARRLPLSVIGLMQYLAPIMQFTFGVAIMGEPMPWSVGLASLWSGLLW
jgi:chloramphenicol-sensitive protein RarD